MNGCHLAIKMCPRSKLYMRALSLQSEYMDVGYSDPGMGLPYTVNINITEIYLVVRLVRLVHDFG